MPTPTGLPRTGEVWELAIKIPGQQPAPQRVVVIERTRGDYWALRVFSHSKGRRLWVDPAYWLQQGWLTYVGPAGPKTKKELGLS